MGVEWRKSSYCNADQPMCVEVSEVYEGVIGVRDTGNPDRHLYIEKEKFKAFVDGVKAGEFDDMM